MGLAQVSNGLAVCAVVENAGSRTAQLGFPLEPCPFPTGQRRCTEQVKEVCVVPDFFRNVLSQCCYSRIHSVNFHHPPPYGNKVHTLPGLR